MKKIVSFALCLVILCTTLMLSSCNIGVGDMGHSTHDLFPEGYTGGFRHQPGANIEYWWVETYEECLEAIELLKSHGSTFEETAIFTYDGDLFDTKYCFVIKHSHEDTDYIKFGDNPFDRRAIDVAVRSYAFFDNVTIDEINHSLIQNYEVYRISSELDTYTEEPSSVYDCHMEHYWDKNADGKDVYFVYDSIQKKKMLTISSFGYANDPDKANQCIKAVLDSLAYIGFDD